MSEITRNSKKAGLPPGALVHIGRQKTEKIKISVIDYDKDSFTEKVCKTIQESFEYRDTSKVSWINIDGLHQTEIIQALGEHYELHPLLLEDVLNTGHRPKIEEFDNYVFLTLKMLGLNKKGDSIVSEQISFILGKTWVISFQEQQGDIFEILRERIRESKGNIRFKGADYLLYRLIDTVVDNYFYVTEFISESTEKLEEKVLLENDRNNLLEIQHLKNELMNLRKAVAPLRDAVTNLHKDVGMVQEETKRYLRDVYEHIIHVNDSIDSQRDILAGIMDLYQSGVSNKMNQVMQLLTIISTIFIPLTFIAGIYGMNFDNIPELHYKNAYFITWVVMIIITLLMLYYFKRKKWL
jgi:magnesium transporter